MAWDRVGRVALVVHSRQSPSDEEWSEFIGSAEVRDPTAVVVISNGVKLSPPQRAQLHEHIRRLDERREQKVRSAVVTDSVVSRGIVTALRWFGLEVRAFSVAEMDGALAYAGVPASDLSRVKHRLEDMEASLARR